MGAIQTTKAQICQTIYKTAVENKAPKEIADELELSNKQVARILKANKYEIQRRASQFVEATLGDALEVVTNTVKQAVQVSRKPISELSAMEISFQSRLGMPATERALEVGGVKGSNSSHSGVTQQIFQQNTTTLSGNVKDFLRTMSDSLDFDESEVIDATPIEEEKEVNLEPLDSGGEEGEPKVDGSQVSSAEGPG